MIERVDTHPHRCAADRRHTLRRERRETRPIHCIRAAWARLTAPRAPTCHRLGTARPPVRASRRRNDSTTTSSALPTRGHRRRRRHRHRRRRLDTAAGTRLEPNRHDPGAGAEARGDASTQRQQRDQQATSRYVQSAAANNCLPATKQSATIRSLRAAPPARVNRPSRHAIYVPSRPSAGHGASQRPPPMGVRPPQRCHLCAGQAARRAAAQSPWIR
jgi:hypothetical protein